MKSLLTLVQQVVDSVGLPRVSAVASGTDQAARQFLALANSQLDDLAALSWPELLSDYSFDTVVSQDEYALPNDFKALVHDTAFTVDNYYRIRGALASKAFQTAKYGQMQLDGIYRFKLYGFPVKMHLVPAPQQVETIAYMYWSKHPVRSADLSESRERFEQDTDVCVFDDTLMELGLKWRIKHAKGLEYAEDFNAYELAKSTKMARALSLGEIPVAQRTLYESYDPPLGYVPQTGFGV